MKASQDDGRSHSQRLASFLLSYRSTPHITTHENPEWTCFLKRKLRTRLDLLCPDVNNTIHNKQAKQKKNHKFTITIVEVVNRPECQHEEFPSWDHHGLLVFVVERLVPLTYLVKVTSGVFWQHVDHLRPIDDAVKVPDQGQSTSPPMPDLPVQSDFHSNSWYREY